MVRRPGEGVSGGLYGKLEEALHDVLDGNVGSAGARVSMLGEGAPYMRLAATITADATIRVETVTGYRAEGVQAESAEQAEEIIRREVARIGESREFAQTVEREVASDPWIVLGAVETRLPRGQLTHHCSVARACETCAAHGKLVCETCAGSGAQICPRCEGSGQERQRCAACAGSGTLKRVVSLQDPETGETRQETLKEPCQSCAGVGTVLGPCSRCSGQGQIACVVCEGSGEVRCESCEGSGYFTDLYSADVAALSQLNVNIMSEAPEFALPALEAGYEAATAKRAYAPAFDRFTSHGGGVHVAQFNTALPMTAAQVVANGRYYRVSAIGNPLTLAEAPPIIDEALEEMMAQAESLAAEGRRAAPELVATLETAEVGRIALDAATGFRQADLSKFAPFLSEGFAARLKKAAHKAYRREGRWQRVALWAGATAMAPLVGAAAVAAGYLGPAQRLSDYLFVALGRPTAWGGPLLSWTVWLAPFFAFWLLAALVIGALQKRRARRLFGGTRRAVIGASGYVLGGVLGGALYALGLSVAAPTGHPLGRTAASLVGQGSAESAPAAGRSAAGAPQRLLSQSPPRTPPPPRPAPAPVSAARVVAPRPAAPAEPALGAAAVAPGVASAAALDPTASQTASLSRWGVEEGEARVLGRSVDGRTTALFSVRCFAGSPEFGVSAPDLSLRGVGQALLVVDDAGLRERDASGVVDGLNRLWRYWAADQEALAAIEAGRSLRLVMTAKAGATTYEFTLSGSSAALRSALASCE